MRNIVQMQQGTPGSGIFPVGETQRVASVLCLLLLGIFFFTNNLFSQPPTVPVGVTVAELDIDTNYLHLGEQTVLKFSVTCNKDRTPLVPNWKEVLKGKLDIISIGNTDTLSVTDAQIKIRQELVVTKFNEDTTIIDSIFVPVFKKRDTIFVGTNRLFVYPIQEQVNLDQDIRDIKSPVDIPYSWTEFMPYIIGFAGLIILIFLILGIVRTVRRRKRKKQPVVIPEPPKIMIPAHVIALEKLNAIKSGEKWFTTDSKGYITELTDVLREYIQNRWGFDARESTTEEILAAEFILSIDHAHLSVLKSILGTADFVKFAKANTGTEENKRMLDEAFTFVELTKEVIQTNDNPGNV